MHGSRFVPTTKGIGRAHMVAAGPTRVGRGSHGAQPLLAMAKICDMCK